MGERSVSETMKTFIEGVVKLIVDKPDEVVIEVSNTTKSVLVQIKAAKTDLGKVIGKKGNTINALKLLSTVVKNTQFIGDTKDVFIEIIEDEKFPFLQKNKKL